MKVARETGNELKTDWREGKRVIERPASSVLQ